MTESETMGWVAVGRIVGAHGVLGELKIHSLTEREQLILDFSCWWLGPEGGPMREIALVSGRHTSKGVLAILDGVTDRDAAQALSGTDIWVPRSQLPEPGDGQYYWNDLVGATVFTDQGEELGVVDYLFATGANDVMVVVAEGEERLLPFTTDIVLSVDIPDKKVIVSLLPGM